MATPTRPPIPLDRHFAKRAPVVRAIYDRILRTARTFGPVRVETKRTSIHLVRTTAFAGVATRKHALILTLKSKTDIRSPRVGKREQTSANRWHLECPLLEPGDVDRELTSWMKRAYEMSR
jgi:hypothetical protein